MSAVDVERKERGGDDGTRRLAEVYSAHARGYAEGWSPVIRPLGRRLLDAVAWSGAERVIDVGTGPGAHLSDIRRLAPRAWLLGLDRAAWTIQTLDAGWTPCDVDESLLGDRAASLPERKDRPACSTSRGRMASRSR